MICTSGTAARVIPCKPGSLKAPPPPAANSIDSRIGEYRMPNGRRPTQPPLPLLGRPLEADDARPVGVDDLPGRLRRRLGGLANVLAGQNLDGAVVSLGNQDADRTSPDQRQDSLSKPYGAPRRARSPASAAAAIMANACSALASFSAWVSRIPRVTGTLPMRQ